MLRLGFSDGDNVGCELGNMDGREEGRWVDGSRDGVPLGFAVVEGCADCDGTKDGSLKEDG